MRSYMLCAQHRAWQVSAKLLGTLQHPVLLGKSLPHKSIPSPRSNLHFDLSCQFPDTLGNMSVSALSLDSWYKNYSEKFEARNKSILTSSTSQIQKLRLLLNHIQKWKSPWPNTGIYSPFFILLFFKWEKKHVGVGCLELMDSNKQIARHIPAFAVNLYERCSPGEVIHPLTASWGGSSQLEGHSIYNFTEDSIKIINERTHECEGTAPGVGGPRWWNTSRVTAMWLKVYHRSSERHGPRLPRMLAAHWNRRPLWTGAATSQIPWPWVSGQWGWGKTAFPNEINRGASKTDSGWGLFWEWASGCLTFQTAWFSTTQSTPLVKLDASSPNTIWNINKIDSELMSPPEIIWTSRHGWDGEY